MKFASVLLSTLFDLTNLPKASLQRNNEFCVPTLDQYHPNVKYLVCSWCKITKIVYLPKLGRPGDSIGRFPGPEKGLRHCEPWNNDKKTSNVCFFPDVVQLKWANDHIWKQQVRSHWETTGATVWFYGLFTFNWCHVAALHFWDMSMFITAFVLQWIVSFKSFVWSLECQWTVDDGNR